MSPDPQPPKLHLVEDRDLIEAYDRPVEGPYAADARLLASARKVTVNNRRRWSVRGHPDERNRLADTKPEARRMVRELAEAKLATLTAAHRHLEETGMQLRNYLGHVVTDAADLAGAIVHRPRPNYIDRGAPNGRPAACPAGDAAAATADQASRDHRHMGAFAATGWREFSGAWAASRGATACTAAGCFPN